MDCQVYCWQAAAKPPYSTDIMAELMAGDVEAYLFSKMDDRANYDVHKNTNNGMNNVFFELFTQSITPSFSGWAGDGSFKFDVPEVENYEVFKQIHSGIMEFVKSYCKTFRHDAYMFNISGHDAYMPFRMIIRDLKFIKTHFSNLSFARGVCGDAKHQKLESLGKMIN